MAQETDMMEVRWSSTVEIEVDNRMIFMTDADRNVYFVPLHVRVAESR